MQRICLKLGDWSGDGHNISEDIYVMSSLDKEQLEDAYKEGCKIVGFDLTKQVATEYEDSYISKEYVDKLVLYGYDDSFLEKIDENDEESDFDCMPSSFADIWMFIAKLGNENLEWNLCDDGDNIKIGGYGLFF